MSQKRETNGSIDRRSFLKYSGALGLGLSLASIMPASESIAFDRKFRKVTRTRLSMGSFVAITVMHPSADEADDAIGKACDEMDRVGRFLNRYDSTSPVGLLNKDGQISNIPREMAEVLTSSLQHFKATDGAFDVTVAPIVDLFKKHFASNKKPPAEQTITRLENLVGSDAIKFDGKNVRFAKESMGITLDGIAVGYVVDKGMEVLEKAGIQHALINAGGEIRAIGGKDKKTPWKVAIQNPEKKGPYVDTVSLTNGSVSTSGDYEIYFDREKLYHHIVNPSTGHSPRDCHSVTILAEKCIDADALSTAVFVMGPTAGTAFINRTPGTQSLIVTASNQKIRSSGWPVA